MGQSKEAGFADLEGREQGVEFAGLCEGTIRKTRLEKPWGAAQGWPARTIKPKDKEQQQQQLK